MMTIWKSGERLDEMDPFYRDALIAPSLGWSESSCQWQFDSTSSVVSNPHHFNVTLATAGVVKNAMRRFNLRGDEVSKTTVSLIN